MCVPGVVELKFHSIRQEDQFFMRRFNVFGCQSIDLLVAPIALELRSRNLDVLPKVHSVEVMECLGTFKKPTRKNSCTSDDLVVGFHIHLVSAFIGSEFVPAEEAMDESAVVTCLS